MIFMTSIAKNSKLHAVYLCPNGLLGGAERFVLDAVFIHQKRNHISASIFFLKDGPALIEAKKLGLDYELLPFSMRLLNPLSVLKTIFYLRRYLKDKNAPILNETMPYSHFLGFCVGLLPGMRKLKRVWFQHGPVGGLLDRLGVMLPAHQILINTHYLLKEHQKIKSLFHWPSPVQVCSYGIRSFEFEKADIEKKALEFKNQQKKYIGLLPGRLCSWKGQDQFLIALGELQKKNINLLEWTFLIVGEATSPKDKLYAQRLKQLTQQLHLGDVVYFTGHRFDVPQLMAASDLIFHTSSIPEPFGLVAAEALMLARPLIGSDQGGITDILINGQTGFNFKATSPDSAQHLAKLLQELLPHWAETYERKMQEMAKRGQELIRKDYCLEAMGERLEQCYTRLVF